MSVTTIPTIDQAITELPDPPGRPDSVDEDLFSQKGDEFLPAMKVLSQEEENFRNQANAMAQAMNTLGQEVEPVLDSMTLIQNSAVNAQTASDKAAEAAASAASVNADFQLKPIAQSIMTQGTVSLDNFVVTQSFAQGVYDGDDTTRAIVTGISSEDFTDNTNSSGYYLDKTTGEVKLQSDNSVVTSGEIRLNTSEIEIKLYKTTVADTGSHLVSNSLLGAGYTIYEDQTLDERFQDVGGYISEFNSSGFTVSPGATNAISVNKIGNSYRWTQRLFTHITWGVDSAGNPCVEAHNPITKQGAIYAIGSGVDGTTIPHSAGVPLDYRDVKHLNSGSDSDGWTVTGNAFGDVKYMLLNSDIALTDAIAGFILNTNSTDSITTWNGQSDNSASGGHYLWRYRAKSKAWTFGTFISTGTVPQAVSVIDIDGNKVRPATTALKDLSYISPFMLTDNVRDNDGYELAENSSGVQGTIDYKNFTATGFEQITGNWPQSHVIYFSADIDTNTNGGGTYFNNPTDGSNLNLASPIFTYTDGKVQAGYNLASESVATHTVDFTGVSDGFNWVYRKQSDGTYGFTATKPSFDLDTGLYSGFAYAVSFLKNPIFVANATPQYIDTNQWLEDAFGGDIHAKSVVIDDGLTVSGDAKFNGGFDLGRTWKNVSSSRALFVLYKNLTDKPIEISVCVSVSSPVTLYLIVDGVAIFGDGAHTTNDRLSNSVEVPPGSTYMATSDNPSAITLVNFSEFS